MSVKYVEGGVYQDDKNIKEMTLRDYFAVKALTGLISSAEGEVPPSMYARASYAIADAMLEARK